MRLRQTEEMLDKRRNHLQSQYDQAMLAVKGRLKAKDQKGARYDLQRSKLYEKEIDQIMGKKHNISTQIHTLESASYTKEVVASMKLGAEALRAHMSESDVDKAQDVIDDITEQMQMAQELSDALSQPLGPPVDEDALSKELADMEAAMMDADLAEAPLAPVGIRAPAAVEVEDVKRATATTTTTATPASSALVTEPAVPTRPPAKKETKDDKMTREMQELEAMMGLS